MRKELRDGIMGDVDCLGMDKGEYEKIQGMG